MANIKRYSLLPLFKGRTIKSANSYIHSFMQNIYGDRVKLYIIIFVNAGAVEAV